MTNENERYHFIHPDGYCEGCGDTPCVLINETEAPERVWIQAEADSDDMDAGTFCSVDDGGLPYVPEALSDAKDKRITELEELVETLTSDPDYTSAYLAGAAGQKAIVEELEAELHTMTEDRNIVLETSQQHFIRIAELEAKLAEAHTNLVRTFKSMLPLARLLPTPTMENAIHAKLAELKGTG